MNDATEAHDLDALLRERRLRETAETLAAANLALAQRHDLDSILDVLLDYLGRLVPSDSSMVLLQEAESTFSVAAARGYENWTDAIPRNVRFDSKKNRILGEIMGEGHAVVIGDTRTDARWERVPQGEHVRSWLGVPLIIRGQTIGLYSLDKTEPGFYDDEHVALAVSLAPAAASAVEIARLLHDLREAAEYRHQIIASADEGIIVVDRHHRCRLWNPFMESLSGLPASAVVGRSYSGLLPVLACDELHAAEARALAGETVTTPDVSFTAADGRLVWAAGRLSPFRNAAGSIIGAIAVVRDRTEHKKVEALICEQNRILAGIAANAPLEETLHALARLVETSCRGTLCTIVLLDEGGGRMRHGAAPSLPEAFQRSIDGVRIGPAAGSCGTAMFRREPVVVTDILEDPLWEGHRSVAALGGVRACWSTPILSDEGSVLGSFAVYYREPRAPLAAEREVVERAISVAGIALQRDRAEAVRRVALEELRERERRFRGMLGNLRLVSLMLDREAHIQYCNDYLLQLTGWTRDEVMGRNWIELFVLEEQRRELGELFVTLLNDAPDAWHHENDILTRSGEKRLIRWNNSVLRSGSGEVIGTASIGEDITEQKRLEDRLRQSQKMEAVGRLAGGIAHDFNNLLGVITGYADMLRSKTPEGHSDRRRIEQIVRAAQRGSSLTRQLLAFSRKQVLEPKVLKPSAVVTEMRKMLIRLISEDIHLVLSAEATGSVKVDPGQLEQLVMNLVVNARDAMPMGGWLRIETADVDEPDGQIHDGVARPGPYVRISVADTGVGMDEAAQARAFEPFFTTKPEGKGTGLGLATVYGIVEQSGGHISMSSEVAKGTVVRVCFPRVLEQPAAEASPPPRVKRAATETVLVVEDEPAALELVAEVLRAEGYSVLLASDGQDAIDKATGAGAPIHLLVTDVVLPLLSGRVAAERIRGIHPRIRVLYMSGYTDDEVSRHGVLEPGIELLQKPFTPDDLTRRVAQVLDAPSRPDHS